MLTALTITLGVVTAGAGYIAIGGLAMLSGGLGVAAVASEASALVSDSDVTSGIMLLSTLDPMPFVAVTLVALAPAAVTTISGIELHRVWMDTEKRKKVSRKRR